MWKYIIILISFFSVLILLGQHKKNNVSLALKDYGNLNNHIDSVFVNDSTLIIYQFKKGVLIKQVRYNIDKDSTLYDFETINFNSQGQLVRYDLLKPAYTISFDTNLNAHRFDYYSQLLILDSLGNVNYYHLSSNFKTLVKSK